MGQGDALGLGFLSKLYKVVVLFGCAVYPIGRAGLDIHTPHFLEGGIFFFVDRFLQKLRHILEPFHFVGIFSPGFLSRGSADAAAVVAVAEFSEMAFNVGYCQSPLPLGLKDYLVSVFS